jgi:uncharacterized protein (DUF433 family)
MNDNQLLQRINVSSGIMVGKPVVKGTRLTVDFVLGQLAHGASVEEICVEYKGLKPEDIQACLLFATKTLQDTEFMPLAS